MTKAKKDEVHLPSYVTEPGFPQGDGPKWIAVAVGATPDAAVQAVAYRGTNEDETAIALHVGEIEVVFRPARLVVTRRLAEVLGARGFPVPFYGPPQLALLGQAISRLAYRDQKIKDETANDDLASLLGGWARDCLTENVSYVLRGRQGRDVRAAIEHIRSGYVKGNATVPLIVEPARKVLLAWTIPVRAVIRERVGTMGDGEIGVQLQRSGLGRARLDARPAQGQSGGTVGMPLWEIPNGWQAVEVEIPDSNGESGPQPLPPVRDRSGTSTRARPQAHTRVRNV